jgi:hypothetical protein
MCTPVPELEVCWPSAKRNKQKEDQIRRRKIGRL